VVETDLQAKALNSQGVYWVGNENLDQAIANFKKALEIDPNFLGYFNLASCYEKKGLVAESVKYYKKAIKLQPNYEIAKNRLKLFEQKEVVKNKPNDAREYMRLGGFYLKCNNLPGAIVSLRKAIRLDSQLSLAYYNLGIAYTWMGEGDLAMLQIEKAIMINPDLKYKACCLIKVNEKRKDILKQKR